MKGKNKYDINILNYLPLKEKKGQFLRISCFSVYTRRLYTLCFLSELVPARYSSCSDSLSSCAGGDPVVFNYGHRENEQSVNKL
jgi:hypothetical protein